MAEDLRRHQDEWLWEKCEKFAAFGDGCGPHGKKPEVSFAMLNPETTWCLDVELVCGCLRSLCLACRSSCSGWTRHLRGTALERHSTGQTHVSSLRNARNAEVGTTSAPSASSENSVFTEGAKVGATAGTDASSTSPALADTFCSPMDMDDADNIHHAEPMRENAEQDPPPSKRRCVYSVASQTDRASRLDLTGMFALDSTNEFFSLESAVGTEAALRITLQRAATKGHIDVANLPTLEETLFQYTNFIFMNRLSRADQQLYLQQIFLLTKNFNDRLAGKPNLFRKTNIVTSMKDAGDMYWRASSSIGRILPKPKVEMVGDYAVVSLKDILLFAVASRLKFILTQKTPHTGPVQCYMESRAGNAVRERMEEELEHGGTYPLQLAMYGWSDDCQTSSLKQWSSVKVVTISLMAPHDLRNDKRYTFLYAVGPKGVMSLAA